MKKDINDYFAGDIRDYSVYACERAIPSGVDGLKPSQRKALYGMLREYPTKEVKVSIASSNIMAVTAFHHGSLDGVIVNMAQGFPGTNNIPLIEGIGQFGSRISPVAAAARYIFVKSSPLTKQFFHAVDDNILEWLTDDDMQIEPRFYLPIIPLVLVNGSQGMGTGFATDIMSYNPRDIVVRMLQILKQEKIRKPLIPWFRGFTGEVFKNSDGQTVIQGCFEFVNTTLLKITELPIGVSTIKYRDHLNALEDKDVIKSYEDNSTESKIEFLVKVPREVSGYNEKKIFEIFKLQSRATETITFWDERGRIKRVATAEELLDWFMAYRLTRYADRIAYMIKAGEENLAKLQERCRFIKLYIENSQRWAKTSTDDIVKELQSLNFTDIPSLLSIRITKLTGDAITELENEIVTVTKTIEKLRTASPTQLFMDDIRAVKLP